MYVCVCVCVQGNTFVYQCVLLCKDNVYLFSVVCHDVTARHVTRHVTRAGLPLHGDD